MTEVRKTLPEDLTGPSDDIVEATIVEPPPPHRVESDLHLKPGFLHPSSLIFEPLAQLRSYLIPAILGIAGAANGNVWTLGVAGTIFGLSILVNLVRYFTLKYKVDGTDLVVTEGFLFRRIRSVPMRRIQNVDYVQNVLHRLFKVAVVNIETASGSKPEATLRVITMNQVEQLRTAIFSQRNVRVDPQPAVAKTLDTSPLVGPQENDPSELAEVHDTQTIAAATALPMESPGTLLWQIPSRQLALAGLASNRGLVLLGIVAGVFFQGDWIDGWGGGNWRERLRLSSEEVNGYIPQTIQSLGIYVQIAIGVLLLLLVLRIVSVVWYFLRFYGYQLSLHGEDLRISCGLFTKVSATIPRDRIQFISLHRPFLLRPLGLATVRIETAGGGGNQNEDAAAIVSRRWFVPVIDWDSAVKLLPTLRPEIDWNEAEIPWQGLSPQAGSRMLRQGLLSSLLCAAIGLALSRPWGFAAGLFIVPIAVLLANKKAKARRYARTSWGLVFQSGLLNKKLSISFLDRLQTVDWSQSFFDRRWNMATLRVDTAAAGPADHLIDIRYLDVEFATAEFDSLRSSAARQRPAFG